MPASNLRAINQELDKRKKKTEALEAKVSALETFTMSEFKKLRKEIADAKPSKSK